MRMYFSVLPTSFAVAAIATVVFTASEKFGSAAAAAARDLLRYFAFVVFASSGWMIRRLVAALINASGTAAMLAPQPSMRVLVWIICTSIAVTYALTPAPAGAATTVEVRVSVESDDAEERVSGNVSLTSSDLELVKDGGGSQTVGLRFSGVTIPNGATILNADIQFQTDETNSIVTNLMIEGEAVDDAATFTTASNSISTRGRTTAAVAWSPVAWLTVGEAGPGQLTPDIGSVIQEIVNRPSWQSGNSLAIIITGTGKRDLQRHKGTGALKSARPLVGADGQYQLCPDRGLREPSWRS